MPDLLTQLITEAISIKRQYLDELLSKANVIGCGVGFKIAGDSQTDEPCIVISVSHKLPLAQLATIDLIPKLLGQIKTDVIETGVFRALQNPQKKMRPAQPGASIGHHAVTAGTFGCLVRRGDEIFILSNNHVLANVNDAKAGDAILQPGTLDGGTLDDKVAELVEFIPLDFGQSSPPTQSGCAPTVIKLIAAFGQGGEQPPAGGGGNHVDCALARPLPGLVSPDIMQIGRPAGVGLASLGTRIHKFGRTSGYTQGRITQIDVTVTIDYAGCPALFHGQLMAGAMSQGGDSGSAVLDDQNRVVGLLFAGSEVATLINPIQDVLDALRVEIVV
ncbi:MAG: hypothetical protein JW850_10605 [Thermoflexales bacterium]|nr:hypothetical protein [Thermoflexales bacterium]